MGRTKTLEQVQQSINVSFLDICKAQERISAYVEQTPVMTSSNVDLILSPSAQTTFYFKCEQFQKTGSFKFRGALNAVSALLEDHSNVPVTSIVAHSSGNHGQAIAFAAKSKGLSAHIVMPTTSNISKVKAVQEYGAQVVRCHPSMADRIAITNDVVKKRGARLIHSFLNLDVVAGQGTLALEFLEQVPQLDAIIVSIGGGGLISGVTLAAKSIKPDVRIFGAEPLQSNAAATSLREGRLVNNLSVSSSTVADGVVSGLGEIGWQVVSNLAEDVFVVTEEEIVQATKLIWSKMKLVIEPSAGVAVAACSLPSFQKLGLKRVGVVLCGGNVDIEAALSFMTPKYSN